MTTKSKLRGHDIYYDNEQWRYQDNNEPTINNWQNRPCGYCGLMTTKEGHDPCIANLPGVINACCGHGVSSESYIQFENGVIVRGFIIDKKE